MAFAPGWKPLVLLGATGIVLAILPARWTATIRATVFDMARPGQQAVVVLQDRVEAWVANRDTNEVAVDRLQDELATTRQELRRLQLALTRLREDPGTSTDGSPPPPSPGAPLLVEDLVAARVLGTETIAAWQAGHLLDRGRQHGITVADLVLEPGRVTLDQGRNAGIGEEQPVYAGRQVVGRISRVGLWTSTIQLVTDPEFRGLAKLARPGRDGPVFAARGMLHGTGSALCRLTLVRSNQVVRVGDEVYTGGRDNLFPWPMLYGTVVEAQLAPGAPHWEIRVRPALQKRSLERVEIFTKVLNPSRLTSTGVLAQ